MAAAPDQTQAGGHGHNTRQARQTPPPRAPRDDTIPPRAPRDIDDVVRGIHNKVDDIRREVQTKLDMLNVTQTELHDNMAAQVNNQLANAAKASHAYNLAPKIFGGTKYENVNQFITQYKRYNLLCKYTNAEALTMLTCFLKGAALTWYTERYPDVHENDIVDIDTVLRQLGNNFGPNRLNFMEQEALLDRYQGQDESFDSFFSDITSRFSLCDLPEAEKFKIFYKAILPKYRRCILRQDVDNIREAADLIKREIQIESMTGDPNSELTTKLDTIQATLRDIMQPKLREIATIEESETPPNTKRKQTYNNRKPPSPCPICGENHWRSDCKQNNSANTRTNQRCGYCSKLGHSINDCYSKQNAERRNSQVTLRCAFCGRLGHEFSKCRSRLGSNGSQSHQGRPIQSIVCPYCSVSGHCFMECALRQAHMSGQAQATTQPNTTTSMGTSGQASH
jgi:hypothetical protein